ncbi:unnamed protein product [Effrenium voratum]|uniref:Protein kinase domain-containing protein n=1 Tax=Effrenium voratum TaxID=2562239 RepID=A0AA36NGB5_9DINO|nr:unnamed protein product [Effrenium voratum]
MLDHTLAVGVRSYVLQQHYTFEHDLGLWAFGALQVLKDRRSGALKTCKAAAKGRLPEPRAAGERLRKLAEIQHPMLSHVTDVKEDADYFFIISARAGGGDVGDWLERLAAHEEVVEEETCASYVAQVLAALVHCHSCGAYHHELRPGSVFLTSRQPDARVLLSDVGVLDALEGGSKNGAEADLQGVGLLALALLLGLTPSQAEDVERHLDDPDLWTPRSQEAFDFVKLLLVEDVPCTAALALQHPWLRNILLRPGLASAGLAREDALSRLTCYLLVLLLIPVEMAHRDLETRMERLLADFQRMDEDGDGLLSTRLALRLLALRGVRNGEVAVAVADARGCGVLDFSAMAAAALMADLLPEGGAARVDDILACLQKLFFEAYATDDDGAVAERSHVAEKVSNSVGNLLRRHGDVSFNEILLAFDEEIDQENLATRLTEASGRGTRLALFESGFLAKEEPGSWFTNLFRTCVQPPQRREIVRC